MFKLLFECYLQEVALHRRYSVSSISSDLFKISKDLFYNAAKILIIKLVQQKKILKVMQFAPDGPSVIINNL